MASGLLPKGLEERITCGTKHKFALGIMGGTFDPIHLGHLLAAEQAADDLSLDAVLFVPAGRPAFKDASQVTEARHRLEMCKLACASNPYFAVSDLEITRPGISYTVDTLAVLHREYPQVDLYFMSGADAINTMLGWKSPDKIFRLAQVVAITRPGYVLSQDLLVKVADFPGRFHQIAMTELDISSSDLRRFLQTGKSIRYLTKQAVYDYIQQEGLYGTQNKGV